MKTSTEVSKVALFFEQLPIFKYLTDKDLSSLSQTSQKMHEHCKQFLLARRTLLSHIVKAEETLALNMIEANIELLCYTSNATDYSKRTYTGYTPFQAAVLCNDVTLWEKIEPYFDLLINGQAIKAQQVNAIFPEGIPKQTPYDFKGLISTITSSPENDIDAALAKEQNNTPICNALNEFRSKFEALARKEMLFNPTHLIAALTTYNNKLNQWSWNKRDLFWRQVVGYTQRFVPACLAQAFVQSIPSIVQESKPLARSLISEYKSIPFFPLADSSGLGFDLGAWPTGGCILPGDIWATREGNGFILPSRKSLVTYLDQQAKKRDELMQRVQSVKETTADIIAPQGSITNTTKNW